MKNLGVEIIKEQDSTAGPNLAYVRGVLSARQPRRSFLSRAVAQQQNQLALQGWIYQAHTDEKQLLSKLLKSSDKEAAKVHKKQSAELAKSEKRKAEVDRLFTKMYEDV